MDKEREKPQVLWEDDKHKFVWLGAGDISKEKGIPANQYMIIDSGDAYLLDPGGYHVFDRVFANVSKFVTPDKIKGILASHQDPDVVESLVSWVEVSPEVTIYLSALWERFIPHLALPSTPNLKIIPDEGSEITLSSGSKIKFIPAHYLHSPGNFHAYDERSKILFCGDAGAAIVPEDKWTLFVNNFEEHVNYMKGFHVRYLPCSKAITNYLQKLQKLNLPIDMICPQHGLIFKGENIGKFVNWLATLKVGVDAA